MIDKKGFLKLADFGLTKYGRYEKQKPKQTKKEEGEEGRAEGGEGGKPALQVVGSPNYIPVEVLRQEKFVKSSLFFVLPTHHFEV